MHKSIALCFASKCLLAPRGANPELMMAGTKSHILSILGFKRNIKNDIILKSLEVGTAQEVLVCRKLPSTTAEYTKRQFYRVLLARQHSCVQLGPVHSNNPNVRIPRRNTESGKMLSQAPGKRTCQLLCA